MAMAASNSPHRPQCLRARADGQKQLTGNTQSSGPEGEAGRSFQRRRTCDSIWNDSAPICRNDFTLESLGKCLVISYATLDEPGKRKCFLKKWIKLLFRAIATICNCLRQEKSSQEQECSNWRTASAGSTEAPACPRTVQPGRRQACSPGFWTSAPLSLHWPSVFPLFFSLSQILPPGKVLLLKYAQMPTFFQSTE